ncbi:MAG TPA: multiheme c-type cytochrome [Polyangiaceae bacterium]|nr:multiheme c-type cytochrome [Polyangiaceae bacterium]
MALDPRTVLGALTLILSPGCTAHSASTNEPTPGADAGQRTLTREELMNPETCRGCHPQHYQEWRGSMHAYASTDPVFHAMNRRGQTETNGALGDFCVRCHAPLAVNLGLTQDGLDLPSVPAYAQGVGCYFCHSASHVGALSNNAITLSNDAVFKGGIFDPASNLAHRSAGSSIHASSNLDSAKLCGACHDVLTPAGVHLERTYAEWHNSIFGPTPGGVAAATHDGQLSCGGCHMPTSIGSAAPGVDRNLPQRTLHDHRFPAVDVALVGAGSSGVNEGSVADASVNDASRDGLINLDPAAADQRARVQALLDTSLGIEICTQALSGQNSAVFVTLENSAAGHRWPSGASQDRRMWVEVRAYAQGETAPFYSSGVALPQNADPTSDPDRWTVSDRMLDDDGNSVHMFWQARQIEEHTLPAPVTRDPAARDFLITHVTRRFPLDPTTTLPQQPSRVSVLVRLQPIAGEVLEELQLGGYLAPSVVQSMPIFELIPNRHLADHPTLSRLAQVSFEWGPETLAYAGFTQRTLNDEAFPKRCVSLAAPR